MAFTTLKEIIVEGQARSVFKSGDVELMALTVWSGIHGLSLLFISGSLDNAISAPVDMHPLTTAVTAMMLEGLVAD
jgi:hypothetical protein